MLHSNLFEDHSMESDTRSESELLLTLESDINHLIQYGHVLDEQDKNPDTPTTTLESVDGSIVFSMEDTTAKSGRGFRSMWDSFFTIRHRAIQGIFDAIRSTRGNLDAYRKKLKRKQGGLLSVAGDIAQKKEAVEISQAGLDPYLTRAIDGDDRPHYGGKEILSNIGKDVDSISAFIKNYPKDLAAELKKLQSIIKSFKGKTADDLRKDVISKMDSLKHPLELAKDIKWNDGSVYLNRNVFIADVDPSKAKTAADKAKPFRVDIQRSMSIEDKSRIAEFVANMVIPIVGLAVTIGRTAFLTGTWSLNGDDIKTLVSYQQDILESTDDLLDMSMKIGGEIDSILKSINDIMGSMDVESARDEMEIIQGYLANVTRLHTTFTPKLANRQLELAKGINYALIRIPDITARR